MVRARTRIPTGALLLCLLGASWVTSTASAVPLFSRQTAQPCGRCHASAPELNTFGRRFKLAGYTFESKKYKPIPLSILALTNYTHTREGVKPSPHNADSNDNVRTQFVNAYTGGVITKSAGALVQGTYEGDRRKVALGNVDVRYVHDTHIGNESVLFGLAIHNDPGRQDPWNTGLNRTWPYFKSDLEPTPRNGLVLDRALSRRVVGASGYGFVNDSLYLELGTYLPLGGDARNAVNVRSGTELENPALYLRAAREFKLRRGALSIGVAYLDAKVQKSESRFPYNARDLLVDVLYQRKMPPHLFSFSASYAHEFLDTGSARSRGQAGSDSNHLDRYDLWGKYVYKSSYGFGLGFRGIHGSKDRLFFETSDGRPDTGTLRVDLYWNPLNKRPPKFYPWVRTRFGIQYAHFVTFDGRADDSDGNGRDAKDNDTVQIYWGLVF